jgi:hypothetical protein
MERTERLPQITISVHVHVFELEYRAALGTSIRDDVRMSIHTCMVRKDKRDDRGAARMGRV